MFCWVDCKDAAIRHHCWLMETPGSRSPLQDDAMGNTINQHSSDPEDNLPEMTSSTIVYLGFEINN
jgi:hypothetical protein